MNLILLFVYYLFLVTSFIGIANATNWSAGKATKSNVGIVAASVLILATSLDCIETGLSIHCVRILLSTSQSFQEIKINKINKIDIALLSLCVIRHYRGIKIINKKSTSDLPNLDLFSSSKDDIEASFAQTRDSCCKFVFLYLSRLTVIILIERNYYDYYFLFFFFFRFCSNFAKTNLL